jgi:N utilization substance protein B
MTDRPSPRRLARELVLQALYASECKDIEPEQSLEDLAREHQLQQKNLQFARALVSLTARHRDRADGQIARLSKNWDITRIAAIDRTILRMAIVELEHIPDTPVKVVLNEAIELARKFSTSESSAFVNGILDGYIKGVKHAPEG